MIQSDAGEQACLKIVEDAIRRHFPKAVIHYRAGDYAARFKHEGDVFRVANISTGGFLVERVDGCILCSDEKAAAVKAILEAGLDVKVKGYV